jgi:transposase
MNSQRTIGIDAAKRVFFLHGEDAIGKVVLREKLSRERLLPFLANQPVSTIAIEPAQRPTMRFVATKSLEQQDLLAIHRIRERLVSQRTGLCNQIRGLLAEYGIVLPQAIARLRRALPEVLEDAENELTVRGRELIASMLEELRDLEERIKPKRCD